MKMLNFVFLLALTSLEFPLHADDWPQWRGPQRNSISTEKGLAKQWPKEGPKLLWKATDVGNGYSTPAVVGNRLYLLSNEGIENEYVAALDIRDGKKVWSTRLGNVGNPKQNPSFPAARSTPTVVGNSLFALSSDGDLACLDVATGKIIWKKSLRVDFAGKPGTWAYAESPLVDGDTLVCAPGGSEATIVALDRRSGNTIWKCALPEADEAAYASAIIVETSGIRQYVFLLQKGLVSVNAKTGKPLWRYNKPVSKYNANIPSPLADGNWIYAGSAGTGGGAVQLKAKDGGIEFEPLYFEAKLSTAIGGIVKIDNHVYGTTGQALLCVDASNGSIKWEERAIGAASLCYADGRIYMHGENGDVALVEPSPDGYLERGRFSPADQPKHSNPMEKAWAYPVVSNGHLYIRDHSSLWCYSVK